MRNEAKAASDVPAADKGKESQDMTAIKKILVVDDEPDILVYLSAIFEDMGYEAIYADGGVQAFEMARSDKPDLITLDITMPDQSGVKTYRNLRNDSELKDIPIIFVSGVKEETGSRYSFTGEQVGMKGPNDYIDKPIKPEELLACIKKHLK